MAAEGNDGAVVGLEEGKLFLPPNILDEPSESKDYVQTHRHRRPPSGIAPPLYNYSFAKSGWRFRQKPKLQTNRVRGGPGMQAVFLDSNQKCCGTGFFLPRGTSCEFQPSKRSGCSPVLVPCRVVQALNLNVNQLGSHLSPRKEVDDNPLRTRSDKLKKNGNETISIDRFSKNQSSSPEIFLPKEWSY